MIADLLNNLKESAGISQDKELAEILSIHPVVISKMRSGDYAMSATYIVKIHEAFGIPVAEIKRMAGVKQFIQSVERVAA